MLAGAAAAAAARRLPCEWPVRFAPLQWDSRCRKCRLLGWAAIARDRDIQARPPTSGHQQHPHYLHACNPEGCLCTCRALEDGTQSFMS